jgi:alanine racemase
MAGATLTVDLGALAANWRLLAAAARPAKTAAVVKADAYGLGFAPVARALAKAGCTSFFVATLDEGLQLRAALGATLAQSTAGAIAGATAGAAGGADIFVLHGPPPGSESEFPAHELIPVLSTPEQVADFLAFAKRQPDGAPPAALHFDTGMNRLGLDPAQAESIGKSFAPPSAKPGALKLVMSHLACAETPDHPLNQTQLKRFKQALAHFPNTTASLVNSAGVFLGPEFTFNLARPGIALYGVEPRPGVENRLAEVAALFGKVLQIRDVDRGMTVGYGAAHSIERPGRIAVVSVGYADGFFRTLSNGGHGFIGDFQIPVVGRVSMDLITLDVSAVPPAMVYPGASVELLGGRLPLSRLAALAGTIEYEVLTRIGPRVQRVYRGGDRS